MTYVIQNNTLLFKIVIKNGTLWTVFSNAKRYFGFCYHWSLNFEVIRHTYIIMEFYWNEIFIAFIASF